jgi:hypothetical protein
LILEESVAFTNTTAIFALGGAETACCAIMNRFEDSVWELERLTPIMNLVLNRWLHMSVMQKVSWAI